MARGRSTGNLRQKITVKYEGDAQDKSWGLVNKPTQLYREEQTTR